MAGSLMSNASLCFQTGLHYTAHCQPDTSLVSVCALLGEDLREEIGMSAGEGGQKARIGSQEGNNIKGLTAMTGTLGCLSLATMGTFGFAAFGSLFHIYAGTTSLRLQESCLSFGLGFLQGKLPDLFSLRHLPLDLGFHTTKTRPRPLYTIVGLGYGNPKELQPIYSHSSLC